MQKLFSFFIALFIGCSSIAQINLDSLWGIWNDTSQADTNRLKAINDIIDGYLSSNTDSAFYFAQMQYDFAESVNNKKWMAGALKNQGVSFHYGSNYTRALEYYSRSLKIREEIGDKNGVASCLNNIGIIYYNQGNYTKAIDYYTRCLKIDEELGGKKGIAYSLGNIGIIYMHQGDLAKAIDYYTKSLIIKEEIGDKNGIAATLNNIGFIYMNQGETTKSLEYFSRSLKIREEIGDKRGIASSLTNIGLIYKEQGDYAKAIEFHTKSLIIGEELEDKSIIASSLNNIGLIYANQGEAAKAIEFHTKSLIIGKELKDKRVIAASLGNIGLIYLDQGDYVKALKNSTEALRISQEIGVVEQIKSTSEILWKTYKKLGKYKQALEMHELYIVMRDSIQTEENQRAAIHQDYKYKYEKQVIKDSTAHIIALTKEKEKVTRKEAELKAKQNQQVILFGGLGLVILFSLFMINRFRVTNRQKKVIETQHEKLNESHKEITDSINYAKRIQDALMTSSVYMKDVLPESFIFFQPKNVVSGDFYWVYRSPKGQIFFTVADCTGHGVPGAFMSMIGNSLLNEMIIENNIQDTDLILDQVSDKVKISLEQKGQDNQSRDGMDMVLCRLNEKKNELMFTGAKNSLVLIRKGEVFEYKGDKRPVGFHIGKGIKFTSQKIKVQKNDMIYLFSDGFVDQFGGQKGKKYMSGKFKKFLLSISEMPIEQQEYLVKVEFTDWLGTNEQIDDVCVMGVRVS